VTIKCILTLTTLSLGNVQQWDRSCCLMPFWIMPNDEIRSLKQSNNTCDDITYRDTLTEEFIHETIETRPLSKNSLMVLLFKKMHFQHKLGSLLMQSLLL